MKILFTSLFFLLLGIGTNTSKVFSAEPPHIKVLFVGYSGGLNQPKISGWSKGVTADVGERTYIDAWEVVYGNTLVNRNLTHIPSDFYKGACGGSNPDVIVFDGQDGGAINDPNWIHDVQNLVHASDGTNASIPQIHNRSSHLFKWAFYNPTVAKSDSRNYVDSQYRELLGAWSFEHDCEPMNESTFGFQNTDSPMLNGVNTASQWYPNEEGGAISGLYLNTIEPSYGNSFQVLLDCSKPVYFEHNNNCNDIGAQNLVPIAWSYMYKGNVRMFSHTYYSPGGQFNDRFYDMYTRALIWCAGKDNATYLKH